MSEPFMTASAAPVVQPVLARRGMWRGRSISANAVAWVALTGVVLTTVLTVLCSGETPLLAPGSTRPLPTLFAGHLGRLGADLHLGGVIAIFTVSCACYWASVGLAGRHRIPFRVLVAVIVVLHLLVALAPPLLSTDLFSYGAYGRMGAVYRINPYFEGPAVIRFDPWYSYIGWQWTSTPSAYGPLFTALSYVIAPLGIGVSALIYKWTAALASLSVLWMVDRLARRLDRDPTRAVAFVGLNPALLIYAVGGAHNDLLMLAALTGGVLCLILKRDARAGALVMTAAAIKLTAGIALPFALAARATSRAWRGLLCGLGLAGAALIVLSFVLFGSGPLRQVKTLEAVQGHGAWHSIPGWVAAATGFGTLSHGVDLALSGTAALIALGLVRQVLRNRMDWLTATGWAIVALLVTSTFLLPWYVVWLLPFAALGSSRWLRTAALVLTAISMTSL